MLMITSVPLLVRRKIIGVLMSIFTVIPGGISTSSPASGALPFHVDDELQLPEIMASLVDAKLNFEKKSKEINIRFFIALYLSRLFGCRKLQGSKPLSIVDKISGLASGTLIKCRV